MVRVRLLGNEVEFDPSLLAVGGYNTEVQKNCVLKTVFWEAQKAQVNEVALIDQNKVHIFRTPPPRLSTPFPPSSDDFRLYAARAFLYITLFIHGKLSRFTKFVWLELFSQPGGQSVNHIPIISLMQLASKND